MSKKEEKVTYQAKDMFGINHTFEMSKSVAEMFDKPNRKPCSFCNKEHAEYPCDAEIESIKKKYNL